MPTFGDLQATIRDDFLNRSDLGDATRRAITRAINMYKRERHWFNEADTATACTVGSPTLGIPSDYFALDRLELETGQFRFELVEKSLDMVRTLNEGGIVGEPTFYHNRGNEWTLAVTPGSAYTINIFYLSVVPDLVLDSDSNVFTNELFNLIAHHATYDLLANVVQQADDAKLSHHLAMLKVAKNEMAAHDIQRLGSGRLRPSR